MRIESTIDIAAPKEVVWEALTDVERWTEWTPTMTSVELLDELPFTVGIRARIRQPGLPVAVWRVTVLERQRYFAWENVVPGLRAVAGHRIDPAGPVSTRVTLSLTWTGWMSRLASAFYGRLARRYVQTEAQSLKRLVEARTRHLPTATADRPVEAAL